MPAHFPQTAGRNAPLFGVLLLLLCFAATGCQTPGIRARELPPELRAARVHSAQNLDLSRFAQGNLKNEIIYAGDTVQLSVSTGIEERRIPEYTLRVDEQGALNVPLVGMVRIAGLELTAAESLVGEASVARGIYRNPQVALAIVRRRSNKITILGAVDKEGTYELPSNQSDLVSAIVAAGGLTTEAGTVVEIRRPPRAQGAVAANGAISQVGYNGGAVGAELDQIDLKQPQPIDPRRYLIEDGAVVMISRRPKQSIQVMGLVKRPGQFEMEPDQDVRLLDSLALAGGRTTEFANEVIVIRGVEETGESVVIKVKVNDAKKNHLDNILLAPGDVVSVEETPLTFTLGELQKYVRFGISATTRLTPF